MSGDRVQVQYNGRPAQAGITALDDAAQAALAAAGSSTFAPVGNGELQGVTSVTRLPDLAGKLVVLKARLSNTGNVYIGMAGVGIPNNVTDTSSGIELAPGDFLTLPIDNLNRLYRICDSATDGLTYMVLA